MTHRTFTGHIPDARVVSWGCTCGAAGVLDYGDTFRPEWAVAVADGRAYGHRRAAALTDDPRETR